MTALKAIDQALCEAPHKPLHTHTMFYKMGPGDYAEHDRFLGITNPELRRIAKAYLTLSLDDLHQLLQSPYNEKRLLALFILIEQYQKTDTPNDKNTLYHFYLENTASINNWNLVDLSAYHIVGAYLYTRSKQPLLTLAQSRNMWERRIAIVATYAFIKDGELQWTFKLAKQLLSDPHDLMHKATGWMLREAGKRDQAALRTFLDAHKANMPRTMLRYAIERFPRTLRQHYLS